MNIKFTKRNEKGLHCRFCRNEFENEDRIPNYINLYETSPIKGIICGHCLPHLEDYLKPSNNNDFMASAKKGWNEIRDDILLNDCEVIKKEDKLSPKFCHECKGSGILIEYGVDLKKPCPICKGQGFIKS